MTICVALEDCTHVDVSPVYWEPETREGWLAAVVAYNLGDGNVSTRGAGTQASFYAKSSTDVDEVARAICHAGLAVVPPDTKFKKGPIPERDTYQTYLCGNGARDLVAAGAFAGAKVKSTFLIPEWILRGSDEVKRSFLAALWGAEGSTPALNIRHDGKAMKIPKMPVLGMSKRTGVDGSAFFTGLVQLMNDLNVDCTVSTASRGRNTTYTLYVSAGMDNISAFFKNVGFMFCEAKSFNAWLWTHYFGAYTYSRTEVYNRIVSLRGLNTSWDAIAKTMGMTKGKVYNVAQRGVSRSSWDFPGFADWVDQRWDAEGNLLKLAVRTKTDTGIKPVFNVRVDSHDHSYLVGDGYNNFNSFETMSGRVYYPFDRKVHVGDYPFDPKNYIIVGQDFNVDPMSSVILQYNKDRNEIWAVDEIMLRQSNTQEVCDELERRYFRLFPHRVVVFPDPAGGNRSSARGESDVQIFREKGINRIHYHKKHPFVADRINAVNSMLKSADGTVRLKIDKRCKNLIESLEQVIYKPGTREVDKSQGNEHIADAIGYPIEFMFPVKSIELLGVSR
jgi:hypothetical protein